jgi:hypothetical protein
MSSPVVIWKGTTLLTQQKESGTLVLSDRSIYADVYRGPYLAAYDGLLARGAFGTGPRLGWVVTSSKVESEKGGIGKLTINWEAGGIYAWPPLPCDEFSLTPFELYPSIDRAAFFSGITFLTAALAKACGTGSCQAAREDAFKQIAIIPDLTQRALAASLASKYLRGEETFYMAAWRYVWTSYSYTMPSLVFGALIEAPLGPLYGYFDSSLSFLRLPDDLAAAGVSGSCFKVTRTWLGAPGGYWDSDVYS